MHRVPARTLVWWKDSIPLKELGVTVVELDAGFSA